jgi:hypothetical protein
MKTIIDPYVNQLVKYFASESLLEQEGIVIAGGFATALYHFSRKSIGEKQTIVKFIGLKASGFIDADSFIKRVGDVDYWILDGTEAHSVFKHWLDRDGQGKVTFIDKQDQYTKDIFKDIGLDFEKATRFSLSFRVNSPNMKKYVKQQIIRLRSYEDISDIFKDYDLSLCKIAWQNGCLYVSGEAESDFTFGTIQASSPMQNYDNSFQKAWSALRLIKYYKRYGFQPTKETVLDLQQVLMGAIDFLNTNPEEQEKATLTANFGTGFAFPPVQAIKQPKPVFAQVAWTPVQKPVEDPYDSYKMRSVNQMRRYYRSLIEEINTIFTLEHYNITLATMLLDLKDDSLSKPIKSFIESGGKIFEPEPVDDILDDLF